LIFNILAGGQRTVLGGWNRQGAPVDNSTLDNQPI
jgi:hypothetical protein